jgi:hypothetical protein
MSLSVNDQHPVLLAQSPHPHLRIRINNGTDVIYDSIFLSALVMKL